MKKKTNNIMDEIYAPKICDTWQNQKLLIKIQNVSLSKIVQMFKAQHAMR